MDEPTYSPVEETRVIALSNDAIEMQERAQIDIQIATAHKYPRVLSRVRDSMLTMATLDEETAASCFYTLPRAGKNISGPGVRLAEIAVSCYGNIRLATRIVHIEPTGATPHVIVQAAMHDLEHNVAVCIEKRRRITHKKNKTEPDEDDINLAVNACSAIAFRDAAFKVIPGALVQHVYNKAREVAVGNLTSLVAKREQVIERLNKYGATLDRILYRCGVPKTDDITLNHMELLIGLGTALKDGSITLEEAFPPLPSLPAEGAQAFGFTQGKPVQEEPKKKSKKRDAPEPQSESPKPDVPEAEPIEVDPETGEVIPSKFRGAPAPARDPNTADMFDLPDAP